MDVAARNILVHTNNLVKISDFGLVGARHFFSFWVLLLFHLCMHVYPFPRLCHVYVSPYVSF